MFRKAGEKNERVAFLFTDTQVTMESMLEDINNILNTGTVPNLFPPEEVTQQNTNKQTKCNAQTNKQHVMQINNR